MARGFARFPPPVVYGRRHAIAVNLLGTYGHIRGVVLDPNRQKPMPIDSADTESWMTRNWLRIDRVFVVYRVGEHS